MWVESPDSAQKQNEKEKKHSKSSKSAIGSSESS